MGEKKAEVPVGKELVRMTGIMKEFPGVKALDNVKLDMYAGEVLALLGENGAGKSTLMKILSGVYQRDDGEIILFGNKIGEWDANKAKNAGVSIIHQELNMCTHLSVAENIFLGRELIKNGRLDNERMNQETKEILHKLNIDIDPREQVSELAVSKQQMVEIAKALSQNAKVLIMDEPTSALTSKEIDELFKIIHQLKSEGIGIIYISHRLEELQHIVDRVIIMRDGKYITQMPYDINRMDEIIANMVGHEIKEKFPRVSCEKGKKILEVKHLNAGRMVRDINLELYEGEIVGIAGLMGAGRTELLETIFGVRTRAAGRVYLNGHLMNFKSAKEAMDYGFAMITEERKANGLFLKGDLTFNTTIANLGSYKAGVPLSDTKMTNATANEIKIMHTKCMGPEDMITSLSGGNQQKVIFGKWLERGPQVFMMDEPTRGIDVGAKYEIYELIIQMAKEGKTIIVVSSEMPEILGITNRIGVMSNGHLSGIVNTKETNQEELLRLSAKYL